VPPYFLLHYLTSNRVDPPDAVTTQRCYSLFSDLSILVPADLVLTSSTIDFEGWWLMWKTHVFRRALGPMLQQIHSKYEIPDGEVLLLIQCLSFLLYRTLSDFIFYFCSGRMAQSRRMMMDRPSVSCQLPL
jgi:hypothetical protein